MKLKALLLICLSTLVCLLTVSSAQAIIPLTEEKQFKALDNWHTTLKQHQKAKTKITATQRTAWHKKTTDLVQAALTKISQRKPIRTSERKAAEDKMMNAELKEAADLAWKDGLEAKQVCEEDAKAMFYEEVLLNKSDYEQQLRDLEADTKLATQDVTRSYARQFLKARQNKKNKQQLVRQWKKKVKQAKSKTQAKKAKVTLRKIKALSKKATKKFNNIRSLMRAEIAWIKEDHKLMVAEIEASYKEMNLAAKQTYDAAIQACLAEVQDIVDAYNAEVAEIKKAYAEIWPDILAEINGATKAEQNRVYTIRDNARKIIKALPSK